MKKILILTVTAGNGHNALARSMKEKLESSGGVEVKIVDILKTYSTKLNVWVTDRGYCISVSKLLKLYNYFFNHYKKAAPEKRYSCPSQNTVLSVVTGLMQEILSFQPDVIYTTHFYGAIAITDLKLAYDLPCVTLSFNYDYVNSPFWEAGIGVDYFAIPNEDFIDEFIAEGYRREQLLPFGLPVDERTLEVTDKAQARKELGLDENLFTVMVMFGGGYWSGGLRIFKQLCKALKGRKAQIIMINGKNEKGFKKIAKMKFDDNLKVYNVGFTTEIPAYMSCADVIINKFGGTSVTEMINKGLPMLITEKLAAQEKCNLIYMKSKGVALSFKNGKELKENILKLMDDGELLKSMSENTVPLRKPAASDLAKFILCQPKADYNKLLSQNIDVKDIKKTVKAALKAADKESRKKK
ncbi:MAG: hypothetical protein K2O67_02930 [Clostridia bacterium]|nr:hypothetical protein [Clostridia bacterium]